MTYSPQLLVGMKTRSKNQIVKPLEAERPQQLDESPTTASAMEIDERSQEGFLSVSSLTGTSEAGLPQQPDIPALGESEQGSVNCPSPSSVVSTVTVASEAGLPQQPDIPAQGEGEQGSVNCPSPCALAVVKMSSNDEHVLTGKRRLEGDSKAEVPQVPDDLAQDGSGQVSVHSPSISSTMIREESSDEKLEVLTDGKEQCQKLDGSPALPLAMEPGKGSIEGPLSVPTLTVRTDAEVPQLLVDVAEQGKISCLLPSSVMKDEKFLNKEDEVLVLDDDNLSTDGKDKMSTDDQNQISTDGKDQISTDGKDQISTGEKKKLNWAQKKRYRWLLKLGRTPEEAFSLCMKPMPVRDTPLKVGNRRDRPDSSTLDKGSVSYPTPSSVVQDKNHSGIERDVGGKISKNGKKKLSGAQRKKYKWHIQQGRTPKEAFALCMKPLPAKNAMLKVGNIKERPDDHTLKKGPVSFFPTPGSAVNINKSSDELNEDKASTNKRKRLSGAQRRRYIWHIKRGRTPEEARSLCINPLPVPDVPIKVGNKRNHFGGSPMDESNRKRSKPAQMSDVQCRVGRVNPQGRSRKSCKQTAEGVKICIIHANFPRVPLSTEQLNSIEEAILTLIIKESMNPCKPHFHGIQRKPGYLTVNCQDELTARWLLEVAPGIRQWRVDQIIAVPEGEISLLYKRAEVQIATVYFPNSSSDSTDKILGFVGAQNDGLDIPKWKVLRRTQEGNGSLMRIEIDHDSATRLEKEGPWVSYKFGRVQFRLKGRGDKLLKETELSNWSRSGQFDSPPQSPCWSRSGQFDSPPQSPRISCGGNIERGQLLRQRDIESLEVTRQSIWSRRDYLGADESFMREQVALETSWRPSVSGNTPASVYLNSRRERNDPTGSAFLNPGRIERGPLIVPNRSTDNSLHKGLDFQSEDWRNDRSYESSRQRASPPDTFYRPNSPSIQNNRYGFREGPSDSRLYDRY